ncbi:hypothetical protein JCM5350_007861 [Sporobolomyces pararoseus]
MSSAPAPPPYTTQSETSALLSSTSRSPLLRLPLHLLLQILSNASLPTLVFTLKPVCRTLHLVACAVTRSRPSLQKKWETRLRAIHGPTASTGVLTMNSVTNSGTTASEETGPMMVKRTREEEIYDIWIAALARYQQRRNESYLLLNGGEEVNVEDEEEWSKLFEGDLLRFMQRKARCEDLVIEQGRKASWIEEDTGASKDEGKDENGNQVETGTRVRQEDVRVEVNLKAGKLLLPVVGTGSRPVWRVAAEVRRFTDGSLEELAYHLSKEFTNLRWKRIYDSRKGIVSYQF